MHRYRRIVLAALVLATVTGLAVAPVAAQSADNKVTVTVFVVTESGSPVDGADFTVSWDGGSETGTTNSNGKEFVDVPEGADATITVEHPDYVRNHPYTLSDASERTVTVTVYRRASIGVTVVDENGPVSDAQVRFLKDGREAARDTTGTDGRVNSGVIEVGSYTVVISKPGYYTKRVEMSVVTQTSTEISIQRGLATIEFVVVDSHFQPPRPIEGATIRGDEIGSIKTQANGIQRVSLPVNKRVTVTIEKDGYQTVTTTMLVGERDKRVEIETARTPALTVNALNDRVIAGERLYVQVTDEYGDPATNATVFVDDEAVGEPDATGVLVVPIEDAGMHEVHAEQGSVSSEPVTVEAVLPGAGDGSTSDGVTSEDGSSSEAGTQGFVAAGLLTEEGLHFKSTVIGVAFGMVLAFALVLYLRFSS